jgi:hypothetical protein
MSLAVMPVPKEPLKLNLWYPLVVPSMLVDADKERLYIHYLVLVQAI